jgi:hypothetical protein
MRQALAQAEDSRLEKERRLKYQGTARLEVLYFRWDQPRELDLKHVEHLVECFRKDTCRRLPERNHISAVIERERISYADLLSKQPDGYAELVDPGSARIPLAERPLVDGRSLSCRYVQDSSERMISPNRHLH